MKTKHYLVGIYTTRSLKRARRLAAKQGGAPIIMVIAGERVEVA